MKRIRVIVCLLAIHSALSSQITMQTNLPKTLPLNSDITFEVKINKGSSANFAKYQIEFARGLTVSEVDSKSGSFSVEGNIAKIIWVMAPLEDEFSIRLKIGTGVLPGTKNFTQKYFYVENEDKREVEMEPITTIMTESIAAESYVSNEDFLSVQPKPLPSLLTTTINVAEISTKNPELLKQQVLQLKKDSKDAFEVGEKEKRKAQLNIENANKALANAETITDENEKSLAIENANNAKQKAESDLEVASRVLVLAKSLDDNANQIDAINRSVNPGSYSGKTAKDNVVVAATNKPSNNPSKPYETSVTVNVDDNQSQSNGSNSKKSSEIESGLVYKIQLGAFSKEPASRDFQSIGKVKITIENGMYKVLYGSFSSKEEAFKQRQQLINKGFDGFVVSYQNGVRVK
jgi:cell division protein FtsN